MTMRILIFIFVYSLNINFIILTTSIFMTLNSIYFNTVLIIRLAYYLLLLINLVWDLSIHLSLRILAWYYWQTWLNVYLMNMMLYRDKCRVLTELIIAFNELIILGHIHYIITKISLLQINLRVWTIIQHHWLRLSKTQFIYLR